MLLGNYARKAAAATFLALMLTNLLSPCIAYALTSGPTQPEATSFEPVDTTDMVNVQTGDMTYNMPLLEVPGPEGGYPLSLSYHAGIQTNEDASWVGLGWTLNPGAITRYVNGYPDDWYNPSSSSHVYWSGGQTTTVSAGVNVGIANTPASIGAGLSFSQDTYQGFGLGEYVSVGGQFGILNANLTLGVSPYGGAYVGTGLSAGFKIASNKTGSLNASFGINATTNFKTLETGFSSGIGFSKANPNDPYHPLSASVLGASISTGGGKPTLEIGGLSASVNNNKAGNISTTSHGAHIDIPVFPGVNFALGFSKVRYSTNEKVNVVTHGSLYSSGWQVLDDVAYDEYALLDDPQLKSIIDYPDPTKVQGGAFPEFDVYSVNAQGLGGNMRPYLFQGGILNQNIKNNTTPLVTYFTPGVTSNTPFFRFENDFSNSYRQNYATYTDPSQDLRSVAPPFDASPLYGYHDANGNNDGNTGYSYGNNLAGSKHVDMGIKVHPTGVLGYNNPVRLQSYMMEGFSITNESGVTYHFGLPAYSYGEEKYQEAIAHNSNGTVNAFNRETRSNPYAYTWYLTTITGPDFVDRNGNGVADDGDWGYWANFEYGKWADNYIWRSPSEGFNRDEDTRFQNCTVGYKEVYYLNAIRTRSNVALFEKDVRVDAKGEASSAFDKNASGTTDYIHPGIFDNTSASSMELTHIYLLRSSDENFVTPSSGTLNSNVLDGTDVTAVGRSSLEAKALRIIDFAYDYSLCPNTSNSFTTTGQLQGKLTLQSVATRGKGGAMLLPSTRFQYDLGSDAVTQSGVSIYGINGSNPAYFTTTNGNFNKGDLITSSTLALYCGVITNKQLNGGVYTYTLKNSGYAGSGTTATVATTKNPPYNKDAYDSWGMYKSDFDLSKITQNENLYRTTSVASSKSTDAWCLRGIITSLGSQIKVSYESDQYSSVGLPNNYPFTFSVAYPEGMVYSANMYNIYFKLDAFDYNITDFFNVGGSGQVVLGNGYSPDVALTGNFDATMKTSYKINSIDGDGTIHATLTDPIPLRVSSPYAGTFVAVNPGSISPTTTNTTLYGGGIRVNQLSLVNTTSGNITSTLYQYSRPGSTQSSGTTSYLPGVLDANPYIQDPNDYPANRNYNNYSRVLYSNSNALYSIARVLPPPGVMYEYVTVTKQSKNPDEPAPWTIEGSTQYQFEVFRPNMVGLRDVTQRTGPLTSSGVAVSSRNVALQRFTNGIGNLRRMIVYDPAGAKVSETINHYLHDGLENLSFQQFMPAYKNLLSRYYYQGFLQERYSEVKQVQNQANASDNGVLATLSAKEDYPCIQTGQTVINYVNGTKTSSQNLAFDFYSGAVTQTLETDAYGNNFLTQTVPAYRAYGTTGSATSMGLKINNDANLNMLTQVAGTYTYKVDANNTKLGLVSATADTWGNTSNVMSADGVLHVQDGRWETVGATSYPNGNVWRPQTSYTWMPTTPTSDGITPVASFADFNWTTPPSSNASWVKTSETTLYDVYSKELEAKDINGQYGASRMGYNSTRVVLTGAPANYYEIAYSGAEDEGTAQTSNVFVKAGNGVVIGHGAPCHTGTQSLSLAPSSTNKAFVYTVPTANLTAGRNYIVSAWASIGGNGPLSNAQLYYTVNGTTVTSTTAATGGKADGIWNLMTLVIPASAIASGPTLEVGCINNDPRNIYAYLDDFLFRPLNAVTTAYVYDPFSGELTHMIDNNNLYTRFEYDQAGRLVRTYKEKLNTGELKKSEYQYNMGACQFHNNAYTQYFTRNNCSQGYVGAVVPYTVPAGLYCSASSAQDAYNQAVNDLNANGQPYANTRGACFIGGSVQAVANNLAQASPAMIVAFDAATGNYTGNYAFYNGTTYFNLAIGTYNLEVLTTDKSSRTITLTGFGSQTGSDVTFRNVTIANSQLTVTVQ